MITAKVGMRVDVASPDIKEHWGLGTITKVEPLYMVNDDDEPEYKELICEDYPSEITLDNGRITEGMECWWSPIQSEGE